MEKVKNYLGIILLVILLLIGCGPSPTHSVGSISTIRDAYQNRQSDIWVEAEGEVIRLLPDDNEGSRHQRFIVRLSHGQTLLIAHNIDIAPRINSLRTGTSIKFRGEYEWNDKGGVVHWTHRDSKYQKPGGWLKYQGKKYE